MPTTEYSFHTLKEAFKFVATVEKTEITCVAWRLGWRKFQRRKIQRRASQSVSHAFLIPSEKRCNAVTCSARSVFILDAAQAAKRHACKSNRSTVSARLRVAASAISASSKESTMLSIQNKYSAWTLRTLSSQFVGKSASGLASDRAGGLPAEDKTIRATPADKCGAVTHVLLRIFEANILRAWWRQPPRCALTKCARLFNPNNLAPVTEMHAKIQPWRSFHCAQIHKYIHAYMHTYIHYIYTYITYIHTLTHTHTCTHTYTYTYTYTCT